MLSSITSIPVLSPIEIVFPDGGGARLLPAGAVVDEHEPDYTVQTLSPQMLAASPLPEPDPAMVALDALDEIEHATAVSEYHDFEWWRSRLIAIRSALARNGE